MSDRCDVLIVGAGIAGSSVAFELAGRRDVVLLERETQPGYHSTGRSAAMLSTTYGPAAVRALARASYDFLTAPPSGFAETALLSQRGMLHLAGRDQRATLEAADSAGMRRLDRDAVCDLVPLLDPAYAAGGLLERDAMAIDVAALHDGYLRGVRRRGRLVVDAEVTAIAHTAGGWRIESAILIDPPAGLDPSAWPMVIDLDERFYIKPEGAMLLVSPADQTAIAPCDVQPDEIDVAQAVERYREVTGRAVRRISHRWAGLRSFVGDHLPVAGPDPQAPDFVWLAGQGGAGIMTAPAMARIVAAQITGSAPPQGPDPACLSAARLRR